MTDLSSQTLHLVAKEMATTLTQARVALEAYAERVDQRGMLEQCADHLHIAHGVLRLVEVYGAALLAEEMEQVTRYLLGSGSDEKRQIEGLDALMRAMVQLPTYLERVLSGGRDLALVLLPLLNDLRSVRGAPLLSEGALLLLNLKSEQPPQPQIPGEQVTVAQWARRLRPQFQQGLLGLIRGERIDENLDLLGKVAEKLEQVATTQPVFQFWWVTGAVIEALRARGLESSVTLKRLLGQADRQIKALYESGEARHADNPPADLLANLLYYVACASIDGGRIGAVRASFKLTGLLPLDGSIEQERAGLSAPSVKLMHTVAAAIKEDLSKVKDVLDIFVRRGTGRMEELLPQLDVLKKISDTLGVLGLGGLRERVQQEIGGLQAMIATDQLPSENALLKVAGVLLSVEDSLDEQLVRLILPASAPAAAADADGQDIEFLKVSEAVLRECIVNLARIKEGISIAVQKPGDTAPQGLDNVPHLLRGITAGLFMLGKGRAAELMEAIGVHVRRLVEPGQPQPDGQRLERVADAIVSLEYYMETLENGRTDPWYMLDNAEICLKALIDATPEPHAPTLADQDPGVTAQLVDASVKSDAAPPSAAEAAAALAQPDLHDIDPQLLELFIEEATEEAASIAANFPRWEQNPMDLDSLGKLRRSFHTLKGSGRMVGARQIGEFAWSMENLLNRVFDKTMSRTPAMIGVLRAAIAALPQLIDQLESGLPTSAPIEEIMSRAYDLAQGKDVGGDFAPRPLADPTGPAPVPAAVASVPAAPDAMAIGPEPRGMDPVLHEIYSNETANHLEGIRQYIAKRTQQPAPHDIPEGVYRAVHTLSGSSQMAETRHGIRITEPLNRYMQKVYDSGMGLPDAGLALLADAVAAIENVVAHIDESTLFFVDQPQLVRRIQELESELDTQAGRGTEYASMPLPAMPVRSENEPAPPAAELALPAVELAPPAAELAPPAAEPAPPAAEPAPPAVAEAFDHEIANIYSEEATELLEAAEASLRAWNQDRAGKAPVAELQRQLHTLKGGARMAGIAAMGDLSHELETLVLQIDNGSVAASDHTHRLMQESLDELARMRELVSGGTLPVPAVAMLAQIRAMASGLTPADLGPAQAEVTGAGAAPEPRIESTAENGVPAAPWADVAARAAAAAPHAEAIAEQTPAGLGTEPDASVLEPSTAPVLPGREAPPIERTEMARVDAELLDTMLNNAGEVSIFRARLGQQVNSIDFNLAELARTVTRLKDQLRSLEIETEAQVVNRHRDEDTRHSDFDPLELDRYSALQQFSRALSETAGDVASLQGLLETLTREAQNLLTQQARVITELQNSLMRTRMVPFQRHVQRLTRLVRQSANDTGKRAELTVQGAAAELDRQVLDRMVPPLEHMLRNAVVHGIEAPEQRAALGKPAVGRIAVSLERDGAEVIVIVTDDGAGINVELIRDKAVSLGLAEPEAKLTDEEAMQLILEPSFSTAGLVTQAAGRGVGMDVVATEVKKLGGGLFIESTPGVGSRFTIRLPLTLAISQALIVRVAEEIYALPLATVEGVVRLSRSVVAQHLGKDAPLFEYGGQRYRFQQLGAFVGIGATRLPESDVSMAVALIRAGEHSTALVTDELIGSREIVVKSLGPQVSAIRGIAGATILGDGRIVIILDMGALVRSEWRARSADVAILDQRDRRTFALVVDDSITVRRVTQRLLERNGMRVLTAKDGIEAVSLLEENLPDIILLDIEMPRMDGYEVAAHVRNDARLRHIPIVMITSRVSEKHRARAIELGVDDYLGKPYQESQLLDAIEPLVTRRSAAVR
jgi:chemosensory pili system protein ChpA (sensor histidine kinase/response regulator)